jgi:hypothetical protein
LPFSFKNVLKSEYRTFFIISTSFPVLDSLEDLFAEGRFEIDIGWGMLFVFGAIGCLLLRTLEKRTNLLHVEGR